jgi:hypothetical protein
VLDRTELDYSALVSDAQTVARPWPVSV